eukprot:CAMPEP_0115491174 /NCGR_PEP_ID=MMETSP0271-20121206/62961_1 /TAXON_ID=71861 /ORGANISM="Scrippsiella trochoidea, Strain CCMP3099" /LENGTH=102 /DNA_ID=CAMNT_0002919499 /DNA_START=1831 /DNA_END=2135 /DNA_ORIENTATION=-
MSRVLEEKQVPRCGPVIQPLETIDNGSLVRPPVLRLVLGEHQNVVLLEAVMREENVLLVHNIIDATIERAACPTVIDAYEECLLPPKDAVCHRSAIDPTTGA